MQEQLTNSNLSVEEFHAVIKVLFSFDQYLGEQALTGVFQFIDGHNEEERMSFLKCVETEFQNMEMDEQVLSIVLDALSCYEYESLPIRQLLLNLLSIVLNRYPQE